VLEALRPWADRWRLGMPEPLVDRFGEGGRQ
jgi:hypothetical protein